MNLKEFGGREMETDSKLVLKYHAWISSRRERAMIKAGCLFVGRLADIPDRYLYLVSEYLPDMNNPCKYVSVWEE